MALLIPAGMLLIGCCVLGFAAWRDPEFKGAGFAAFLYFAVIGGPTACAALGAWGLVRTGTWDAVSAASFLAALERAGIKAPLLREPAPWPAVQALNQWYLEANLGWTLLVVPAVLIGLWLALTKKGAPPPKK